jgi:putative metalloprotease
MKKYFFLLALMLYASASFGQLRIGGRAVDLKKATEAVSNVAKAVTLTDQDVVRLCRESVEWMDENNPVLPDDEPTYGARLKRLTENLTAYKGLNLNFKVYHVVDVNAFACGDGSVRVFSSLMDVMSDDELLGVIGHEIGHIYNTDTKDAIKTAYATSGLLSAASAAGGTVGKLSDGELGSLVAAFTDAKFSQKQEYAADDFALQFCTDNGINPYAMALSLEKLVELSGGDQSSKIAKMFSSHPDSEKRAVRARELADKLAK